MMKRLSLFAITALAAIACNKSELEVENPNTPFEGTPMTITIDMPSSADTKLDLDQTGDTWITKWKEGDKLTALHYSGTSVSHNNTNFTLSKVSDDGKSATFEGSYDESQDGMVLVYSGANAGNLLSDQAGLTLTNQSIKMSTKDDQDVVTPNPAGGLSEYSYMISEQVDLSDVPEDYNTVNIKHLTALMELKLQLKNLPEGKTFSVSEVQVGVSEEDYNALKEAFDAELIPVEKMPVFATLYNEEYYDITKGFGEDGFSTASDDMGVYNLAVEGCEISSTHNTFTIPFNAFPFTVKQGEYFNITVVLTENSKDVNASFNTYLDFQICNDKAGSDLEFPRGKHHTISYAYTCEDSDFEYIWDGSTFESVDEAKAVLGEPVVADVYEIATPAQLAAMSYLVNNDNENYGSKKYVLVNSIDLNGKPWTPIGTNDNTFSGNFNGQSCAIEGLSIDASEIYQGLFGYAKSAIIADLSVAGSITSLGTSGGIVGKAENSIIRNCYNNTNIEARSSAGGIVGSLKESTVINCYNSGIVNGLQNIGGVVGIAISSNIINCYNTATITGKYGDVGGVSGQVRQSSSIINCYNSASVTNTSEGVPGGVIGTLYNSSSSTSCYWNSDNFSGSGIGKINETSSADVTPMTDDEMQSADFINLLTNNAYFYNLAADVAAPKANSWANTDDSLYPVFNIYIDPTYTPTKFEGEGIESNPYKISTAQDLHKLSLNVNVGGESYTGNYFEMTGDIDLKDEEFTPIGIGGENKDLLFKGKFEGGGYTVSNLKISSSENTLGALFGVVSNAFIANLSVTGSVSIDAERSVAAGIAAIAKENSYLFNCSSAVAIENKKDNSYSGGVCGMLIGNSEILNCCNTASITNSGNAISITNDNKTTVGENFAGGIVGIILSNSRIVNCYNRGDIAATGTAQDGTSSVYAAGIAGSVMFNSNVNNCYSSGKVSSNSDVSAGVIGKLIFESTAINCYWDNNIFGGSGIKEGADFATNIKRKTTSEMQSEAFAKLLNNGAYTFIQGTFSLPACAWEAVSDNYPVFSFNEEPTFTQFDDVEEGTGF